MEFYIITLFPKLFDAFLEEGVIAQAYKNQLFDIHLINPRDFCEGSYKSVDDRPYGGGDGMVMSYIPLEKALRSIPGFVEDEASFHVVYLSPQGEKWLDSSARQVRSSESPKKWVLVCGRYAGIDQRFLHRYVDREVSIGDFVVSGGEYPAILLIDSMVRYLPGALGNELSANNDSFTDGLLEGPVYTRPHNIDSFEVPAVLQNGHHEKIREWQHSISILKTAQLRPDMLKNSSISSKDLALAKSLWNSLSSDQKLEYGLSLEERGLSVLTQINTHDSK